jgi:replicative DNA helicase
MENFTIDDLDQEEVPRPHGVFDAGEAVALTLNTMAERKEAFESGRTLSNMFGLKELDDYVLPFFPGDYISVQGLPSCGKSFTSRMMALRVVNLLKEIGDTDRVVVWATTEETVEKVTASWLAAISNVSTTDMLRGQLLETHKVAVNTAVAEVASYPLWVVGHTLGSSKDITGDDVLHTSARLARNQFEAAFDYIAAEGKEIVYLNFDYLQRVARGEDDKSNREQHIRHTVDWGRDMGNKFSCPFVMVAQTKTEVSKWEVKLGTLESIEWSASLGQSCDTMFSVWMPKTNPGVGNIIDVGKWQGTTVTDDMMFLSVAKQKEGAAQDIFLLKVKPHLMQWEIIDKIQTTDFNPKKEKQPEHPGYMNTWEQAPVPYKD